MSSWNRCKYMNCPEFYDTLHKLILHVENHHLNFDEKFMEEYERQNPQFMPMSYILRYSDEEMLPVIKEESIDGFSSNTPTTMQSGSYSSIDDVKEESDLNVTDVQEDYNTKQNYYMPESPKADELEKFKCHKTKKYCCTIPGCMKRYKNRNGMKYHIMNFHHNNSSNTKPKTEFNCHCGKQYKTIRGLQSHFLTHSTPVANNPRLVPKYDSFKYKQNFTNIGSRPFANMMQPTRYYDESTNYQTNYNYGANLFHSNTVFTEYTIDPDSTANNNGIFKRI